MKRADETVLPAEWLIPTAKPVIRWHKINIPLFKTLSFILFRCKICMEYIESTLLALHHPGDEMFIGNSLNQSNWVLNVAPSIVNHSTNPSTMPVTVGGGMSFQASDSMESNTSRIGGYCKSYQFTGAYQVLFTHFTWNARYCGLLMSMIYAFFVCLFVVC